ncbi:MAG: lytic murein transglycosylase [Pseudomonadota bacterium]
MLLSATAIARMTGFAVSVCLAALLAAQPAAAQSCGNSGAGFQSWLAKYRAEAAAKGISKRTLSRALSGVAYDRRVIRRDRSQRSFKLSFAQFYKRRVGAYLMKRARTRLKRYAGLLNRIEKRFGVPREVLISIWGLETDFGRSGNGKYSIIQSIATLAYDCRRASFFRGHLLAALRIVQKGDMSPRQMRGGWAGEIGQVQFLPGSYDRFAIDYDGDGRRDLVRSVPDMLASTANYLRAYGWKRGAGWQPGQPNYRVIKAWNKAGVYAKTIAKMSLRLS